MLKLRQKFALRVPDRLAVTAALVLTVTALTGVLTGQGFDEDGKAAPVQLLKPQQADTQADDAVERHSARARLLLFRRG
jgi:hypothetical protein